MSATHCINTPPSSPQAQLPAGSDFVLTGPRFEERQGGRTLWKGLGAQAQGDMDHLAVQALTLERVPQSPNETPWTLMSPNANMDFEAGTGHFTPVRLVDANGHVITASAGHYDAGGGSIELLAPLALTSPTLEARAVAARIDLRTNCMDITGPVEGTLRRFESELGP